MTDKFQDSPQLGVSWRLQSSGGILLESDRGSSADLYCRATQTTRSVQKQKSAGKETCQSETRHVHYRLLHKHRSFNQLENCYIRLICVCLCSGVDSRSEAQKKAVSRVTFPTYRVRFCISRLLPVHTG